MYSVTLKLEIDWSTDEWSGTEGIEVTITEKDMQVIKQARAFMAGLIDKQMITSMNKVCVWVDAQPFGDDSVRSDVNELRIYSGEIYVYCQSKYDASVQWEASINEVELEKKIKLNKFINNLVD